MGRHLRDAEKLDWLQLIRTQNIGPITFHRLLAKYKSADEALKALPSLSQKAGRRKPLQASPRAKAESELRDADRMGARLIAACEPDYPEALAAIPDHPPILFVRGHPSLFEKPAVAIIGARNASGAGRKIARTLAADLGAAGYVVVSGLARGIDGAAHEASLQTGAIAVVAGGVDVIYPPEHADLTAQIAAQGAVISECPMGVQPTARDFPKRNRLIAGLSRGVVVVEAAAKSGTLITANFANDQGREVFAVPGSPLDPRCQGANKLIREGATLVERAEDVIETLAAQTRKIKEDGNDLFEWAVNKDNGNKGDDKKEDGIEANKLLLASIRRRLLELLNFTPLHLDAILREMEAPHGLVADALLELTLSGEAEEQSGGRYSLRARD